MKKGYKILIIFLISLVFVYYVVSLLLMNNNVFVTHYFSYDNVEQAKQKGGLINENVSYKLNGFDVDKEKQVRNNVKIWTSKSNYEAFCGVLIRFEHEDKEMLRLNINLINEDDIGNIFDGEIRYQGKYKGLIYGSSFDVFRSDKSITLDVIEYQNHKPIKLGEIIIDLN